MDCTLIWQNRQIYQIETVMSITSYQASTPLTLISSDPWVPSSDHRYTDLMVTLNRDVCSKYKTVDCSSNSLVDSCQAHLMSHLSSQDLREDLFPDSSLWRYPRGPRGTQFPLLQQIITHFTHYKCLPSGLCLMDSNTIIFSCLPHRLVVTMEIKQGGFHTLVSVSICQSYYLHLVPSPPTNTVMPLVKRRDKVLFSLWSQCLECSLIRKRLNNYWLNEKTNPWANKKELILQFFPRLQPCESSRLPQTG